MKLKEILNEKKGVKVTKKWWKKASEDDREQAMLSVVKDPDDIDYDLVDGKWENLDGWMQRDMYFFEGKLDETINNITENELFVKKEDIGCFTEWLVEAVKHISEAEYQGRKVKLNKPMQGDGNSKFKVYVKDGDKVKKVGFGAKGSENRIKKSDPARRKSFRARHNCDNPGPKTKARYWSCRKW